ncbi:MAG: bifunctional sulfate adenylyltransferase/adenylylsulfate kinase [Gemmatimonadetes bacterium]|uniref:Adenylyl-sulfate kinase n=1 Tax=Candidatus Kutchimonas denitrificans TaxID=3056748 RepID=A0AAE5CAX5_9BACT|nr:bifunctional sulfate adenylyltransferase/adenylylsulfate kinase [Gemmatimonadota bacterium]NIR73800.1 bifunctional sulfate adenylyltransferase/adenylylsulfate kinase [Candidatus Kutchimonas denitrificans]NIS03164.1 bifunctional sulfate adenylyltransferase/adenylylsulfate kinase [Gemmatimonadota bacterium]NIT69065.1 bifunctional sulfate adenylyltransferase/adenylylsulfate kinase [Gemmatimonadota bacterium]NIU54156.1 bifunctional sulfate adenylyltransferase/adenylylsulfate kinase [Gemmatimonad
MTDHLIAPHGGTLVDLLVDAERAAELQAASRDWPSWDVTERQLCDLELLLNGGFSPLQGFMTRTDYESVRDDLRLNTGVLWPIPITLDVPKELAGQLEEGSMLALRDNEGVMLAALHVEDVWEPDRRAEAKQVFGTTSPEHPGVAYLESCHPFYVGGRLEGLQPPIHYDFRELRNTPAEVREGFGRLGWRRVVAFQTRNPMHRAHQELTLRAAKDAEANLLIHPVVGMTKPGDVDHYTRVRCYQALLPRYPHNTARLSLLPLAMRLAGPREAVWHAIIRKNFGCTHLIVGRDHAGPGSDSTGRPFYGPYDAQELLKEHEEELGVTMVPFRMMVYAEDLDKYVPDDEVPEGARSLSISGTDLRRRLAEGREIPAWFTYPEVAEELRRSHPPRHKQGFTVFFTGLSGSGKSTIANALLVKLLEMGGRPVTLLDGDIVRKNLSSELGFSKEHRDINIRRIGFVASEITKNGGIAICAPIAPYDSVRREVRRMIEPVGGFVLVHVATPLEVCEERDRKGLYAKARAGIIKEFTGISDPYEAPTVADVVVDTSETLPEEAAQQIILQLEREGFIAADRSLL